METWSKQNEACSLSFEFGERSYYGTHVCLLRVNGNEVASCNLPDLAYSLIKNWLQRDNFSGMGELTP